MSRIDAVLDKTNISYYLSYSCYKDPLFINENKKLFYIIKKDVIVNLFGFHVSITFLLSRFGFLNRYLLLLTDTFCERITQRKQLSAPGSPESVVSAVNILLLPPSRTIVID
jgi:hypothetical protein